MHRLTEQRWADFFWILLNAAVVCQGIAFVSPAWLKVFINFEKNYIVAKGKGLTNGDEHNSTNSSTIAATTVEITTPAPKMVPVNQDYGLWYMTQCHVDTWQCDTLTYYHINFMDESYDKAKFQEPNHWFLDRTNLFLNGVELRFDYATLSENQAEYTLGLLVCCVAWWLVYKHRKRLVKKNLDKVTSARLIAATVTSFFSGLFVIIPVGRFGNMCDQLRALAMDYPSRIAVHKPVGLGFAAAGGSIALLVSFVIGLRIILRSYCPDCVDLPSADEVVMRETVNQVNNGAEKRQSQNSI